MCKSLSWNGQQHNSSTITTVMLTALAFVEWQDYIFDCQTDWKMDVSHLTQSGPVFLSTSAGRLHDPWWRKTRMMGLSDSEKNLMICSAVLIQYTRVTVRQTDRIGVAYTRYSIYAVARKNWSNWSLDEKKYTEKQSIVCTTTLCQQSAALERSMHKTRDNYHYYYYF